MRARFLNSKEKKKIFEIIKKQWNAAFESEDAWLLSSKDRVYVVSRDIGRLELDELNINNIGLYFGQLVNNELRLSIEGSQIIGRKAKSNVVELNDDELKQWFEGYDLDYIGDATGFVIVKHKNDFVGCGKVAKNKILNYVPKARRIVAAN
ncbi:hypothetical protein KY320_01130 [Candidatus Woesearchaeota archaeon]|nr:hypothetical protein [Candidatus Woesearchaeota archaeon]